MNLSTQKEQFSRAYVQAVAAVAGYSWSVGSVDNDSVDLTLSARGKTDRIRSPKLDLQLKCHTAQVPTKDFSFELEIKNYNDLRFDDFNTPRILVVVIVPHQLEE